LPHPSTLQRTGIADEGAVEAVWGSGGLEPPFSKSRGEKRKTQEREKDRKPNGENDSRGQLGKRPKRHKCNSTSQIDNQAKSDFDYGGQIDSGKRQKDKTIS
jgi:hypothetical protein